ncbi:hypothetical protein [Clostridium sp. YIM B02551]|uniref:hypothetical protein n=1 Tax=Clostridium sp. YIM B02551 TaxID=2910679 RepID=UPI001EEC2DEF|nr:hypothetical protein [Clostridium sp. YIM B02551]
MINVKKVAKVTLGLLLCSFILGKDNISQAKSFNMALAPGSVYRAVDAPDTKDTKDYSNYYSGYINLAKIYDADSYWVQAKAVGNPYGNLENDDNNIYSSAVKAQQGAGNVAIPEGWKGKQMSIGSTYYLALKNLNNTSDYRNASGTFGWY